MYSSTPVEGALIQRIYLLNKCPLFKLKQNKRQRANKRSTLTQMTTYLKHLPEHPRVINKTIYLLSRVE